MNIIKNIAPYIVLLFVILTFMGFHFFIQNPLAEGNTLGILLLLGTIFSLLFIFIFPKTKKLQNKFIVNTAIISIITAFSFVFIDNAHNDLYRYIWDGKASTIEIETRKMVYETTPRETYNFIEKNEETNILFEKTGFHDYYTTYPPTLQLIFLTSSKIFAFPQHQERGLKFIFFLFFAGSLFLIWKIFGHQKKYRKFIPSIFLSPLFLWEGVAAAHSEIIFVFFVLLSIYFLEKRKFFFSGFSLSALVWVKFFPVLLGFIFLHTIGKNIKNIVYFITGGLVSTAVLWSIFTPFDSTHFFEAIELYALEWRMFPLFFGFIENNFSIKTAQVFQLALPLVAMLISLYKKYSFIKTIFYTLLAYLLCAPAVFSWYFLWIFPLGIFVLGSEKKYVLLFALSLTPFIQYFYTIFNAQENIFYYENNGLLLSQTFIFWGVLSVSLVFTFIIHKLFIK